MNFCYSGGYESNILECIHNDKSNSKCTTDDQPFVICKHDRCSEQVLK